MSRWNPYFKKMPHKLNENEECKFSAFSFYFWSFFLLALLSWKFFTKNASYTPNRGIFCSMSRKTKEFICEIILGVRGCFQNMIGWREMGDNGVWEMCIINERTAFATMSVLLGERWCRDGKWKLYVIYFCHCSEVTKFYYSIHCDILKKCYVKVSLSMRSKSLCMSSNLYRVLASHQFFKFLREKKV